MDTALLQALLSGAAVGGAYALVALGFSITFTTTKTLNFGQGEFVSAGAFVGASVLLISLGKPFSATSFSGADPSTLAQLGALLAAMLLMGLIGWLLYALGVRPFAGRPGMAWVMNSLVGTQMRLPWLVIAAIELGLVLIVKALYDPSPR